MKVYIVRWDYDKSQITWTNALSVVFGDDNEGLRQEAITEEDARKVVGVKFGLNPVNLKAIPVQFNR